MLHNVAPRLRFWVYCLAVYIGMQALVRIALTVWLALDNPAFLLPTLLLFPLGVVQDIAMGALLGAPFIIGLLMWRGVWARKYARVAAHVMLFVFGAALIFTSASELFFWNEFEGRFDSIAVNYLVFPREVIGNIRESFDLGLILTIVGVLSVLLYGAQRKPLIAALNSDVYKGERRQAAVPVLILFLAAAPVLYFAPYSLDERRQINEISTNGMHSFLRAAFNNDARYVGLYPVMGDDKAIAITRQLVKQDNATFLPSEDPISIL